jgi:hypothetical protein
VSRAVIIVATDADRRKAVSWVQKAPWNTRVEFRGPRRTLPQNDLLWASLTDIAKQVDWHGVKLTTDDWKLIFLSALKQEMRLVPNLDGTGFVNLGRSSSDLAKAEMSDLIELIYAFGAQHGVEFHKQREAEDAGTSPAPT